MSITIIFIAAFVANFIWDIFDYINNTRKNNRKEKDMSDKYVTLDEFLNERGDFVKQVVYKVDGNFNGNISGENVTVILMGDGNINGNIKAKNGEVFVNKGNINGDVKADKVLCPTPLNNKYVKHNPAKDVESPTLPTRFEGSNPTRCKCESCTYYMPNGNKQFFWCAQGGMLHLCIKEGTTICKYYKGKYDY